jgi:DNA repair protein RadA/Sms
MAKGVQTKYICRQCGYESPKWMGNCPGCKEWGTLDENVTIANPTKGLSARTATLLPSILGHGRPKSLSDVPSAASAGRIMTGIGEFDRVLGGGIVPGALILIGGDPGIGKSTLLTQAAGHLALQGCKTLYVSG